MKLLGISISTLLVLCLSAMGPRVTHAKGPGSKAAVVWPAADIKWSDSPVVKGAKVAVLWGNPKRGGYGALKMLPAGATLGTHTHTSAQKVVMLSGTMSLSIDGGAPKDFGPGSYAFVPGGLKHSAQCQAGSDCTYFEEQPGPSDIKVVSESSGTK